MSIAILDDAEPNPGKQRRADKRAKRRGTFVRWFVGFRCGHCGTLRIFLYTQEQAPGGEADAVRLAVEHFPELAAEPWRHVLTDRKQDPR